MEPGFEPSASHAGHNMDHSMAMAFNFNSEVTILFEGWKVQTTAGMVGSCIAVFFIGLLFEAIKSFRTYCLRREASRVRQLNPGVAYRSPEFPGEGTELHQLTAREEKNSAAKVRVVTPKNPIITGLLNRSHLLQTLLNVFQFLVGYSLMLIFMTYNVWLCLAVMLGIGFGYFFFAWDMDGGAGQVPPQVANGDCCH